MKQRLIYLIGLVLLLCSPVQSHAQIGYQYWIDNDTGSAVNGTTTDGGTIIQDIDVAGLTPGVHFYNFRSRNGNKWGTVYRYLFYILREANAPSSEIQQYQYWLDNDYEHRVTEAISGDEASGAFSLDVSSLSSGIHFLNLRSQDASGVWGAVSRTLFCIPREAQPSSSKLIKGYRYMFGNGPVTDVTLASATEYTLVQAFDIPEAPLPSTVDDECHFSFIEDEATLLRNVEISFALAFVDEAEAMSSPVGTSFTVTDTRTTAIETLPVLGSLTLPTHATGGYSVVKFTIPHAMAYTIKASAVSSLRLYSSIGEQIATVGSETLAEGYTQDYEADTYYAVVYGNDAETALTISLPDVSVLKPTLTYSDDQVTITSTMPDATFRYTTDGTDPTVESTLYESPISVDRNMTIKAITVWAGAGISSVAALVINTFKVADVTFTQDGGSLTMATTTEGASISYRIDDGNWTAYSSALALEGTCTIEAYATKDGYSDSEHTSYLFSYTRPTVITPQIVHDENLISILDSTTDATIYYTLDGSDPTAESTVYTEPFTVTENCTIKAIAIKEGYNNSEIVSLIVDWIVIQEPCGYAVFDSTTGTLTFKYGVKPEGDNVYEVEHTDFKPVNSEEPDNQDTPWIGSGLKKVVFDASFAEARPVSTARWFAYCSELTEIVGLEYLNTSETTDMNKMFCRCTVLTSLDVSHFNTSKVTNMSELFSGCKEVPAIDVSHFDTSNVTDMSGMFSVCHSITSLDVSHFNTSKVTNMSGMFGACLGLTSLDVSHFDTSSVTDMSSMLSGFNGESLDISKFDTSNVTDMSFMFANCGALTSLDLSNFDTSNVTNMSLMFSGCSNLTSLDLGSFNTSNVTIMVRMFSDCTNLKTIYVGDGWTVDAVDVDSPVKGDKEMLDGCTSLIGGMGTRYDSNYFDKTYAHIDEGTSNPGYFTRQGSEPYQEIVSGYAILDSETGTLTFKYGVKPEGDNVFETDDTHFDQNNPAPWHSTEAKKVIIEASFAEARPLSTAYWFVSVDEITGLDYLNTSNVTNMEAMFEGCSNLTSLDLSNFDTSNVTAMQKMFDGCSKLKIIYVGDAWSTASVEDSDGMFTDCKKLVGGEGTLFDTNYIDMTYACIDGGMTTPGYFTRLGSVCGYAVLDSKAGTLTFKYGVIPTGDNVYRIYDANYVKIYKWWYGDGFISLWYFQRDVIKTVVFDESYAQARPQSTYNWFAYLESLESVVGLEYLNTSETTNMGSMFYHCSALTDLDLSHFDTSNVTDMSCIFCGCNKLTSLDVGLFGTSNVTSMAYMFDGCSSLTSLDLGSFATGNVINMQKMFNGCTNLKTIYVGDGWTVDAVNESKEMFEGCISLIGVLGTLFDSNYIDKTYANIDEGTSNPGYFTLLGSACGYAVLDSEAGTLTFKYGVMPIGDNVYRIYDVDYVKIYKKLYGDGFISPWYSQRDKIKTVVFDESYAQARPQSTYNWFAYLEALESFVGIENLNTSETTNMGSMFYHCSALTDLDLSHFDTSKVTDMSEMFNGCTGLAYVDISHFDTSNVTDMSDMFKDCTSLSTEVEMTYADGVVTISSELPGATIYYTINGEDPTQESSVYEKPIPVNHNMTIKAFAEWTGVGTGSMASLVIDTFTVTKPVFTYQYNKVTISCATDDAVIYYTMDGSLPSSESKVFSDSFVLTENCTIKAIAIFDGYNDSEVCTLEVTWIMKGDANLDGKVDEADVKEVTDYIMGRPSEKFNFATADATGDGVVNAADIVAILIIIKKAK